MNSPAFFRIPQEPGLVECLLVLFRKQWIFQCNYRPLALNALRPVAYFVDSHQRQGALNDPVRQEKDASVREEPGIALVGVDFRVFLGSC